MNFAKGDLFHIAMRNGIYQVLAPYTADDEGNTYYFRKVFDGKLNFKLSKAEIVHEGWMSPISDKTKDKLSEVLKRPEVREALDDLTIDRMMQFGVKTQLEIFWCTMDPKSKKNIEKALNTGIEGFVNPFLMRNAIRKLHDEGALHIEPALSYPPEGKRLYRVELGHYCDDFDEFGNERFRAIRFKEIKIHTNL